MTTYTWSFPQFDVAKSEDGLTDVVKTIHWRYDATDGGFSVGAYGTVSFGKPDPQDFIPYADLTEAWAIAAVSASIDVPAMDANLAAQIAIAKNPPIIQMAAPFER